MIKLFILVALLQVCFAPPLKDPNDISSQETSLDDLENYLEYHRYIKEVVKALESDPVFKQKLERANDKDIKTGKIASELELVSHHIRTQLDEIKRNEMHRLKTLAAKRDELLNNELNKDDPLHHHIDHGNEHTFEIEDLKRLIVKTTEDLAEADRKRREEFKEYELKKEFEKIEKLNHTTGDEREKLEQEYKQMDEKHKKHDKIHTPGHKQHLEEVWEEQDHMSQDFNPKTFFMLHDLDGNGLWDQDEVKALFIKELDKMYSAGAPEDDMRERLEEMERMRESVFKEIDTNRDGFIDFNEFLYQTKRNNYDRDPGWKTLDEEKPFTDEELEEYVRRHNIQYDPHQYNNGQYPYQGHPQQGQMPPPGYANGQMPPQGYQQGYHPQSGQMPPPGNQQGYHPQSGQMPPPGHQQGQFHPGQLPQAQVHPQHIQNNGNYPQHGNDPSLNTNEIYPNQQYPPQHQQQFNQNPSSQVHQQQQQQASNNQGNYPNQQQQPPPQRQQVPQQKQPLAQQPPPEQQKNAVPVPLVQNNQQPVVNPPQPEAPKLQKAMPQQNLPQQPQKQQAYAHSKEMNANAVPKQAAVPIVQSNNVH